MKFSDIIYSRISFNGVCLCVIRKPLIIIIQKATHLAIPAKCIKWKITKYSGSTPVLRLQCSEPRENSYKPLLFRNHSSLATFLSLTVKAHVHSITHCQLWNPQHTYAVRQVHFKMNWAFKVIQGHPYWCQQKSRIDCCRNVQPCRHYFRNLRRHASGKLQIRQF